MTTILLGTQGWNYPAWVGPFYPPSSRPSELLSIYARAFKTVEVDSTFYAIPAESVITGWKAKVPPGFLFSLKVPQEITHDKMLAGVEVSLTRFVTRAKLLGDRLGAMLVQLSPEFRPTDKHRAALERFLGLLAGDVRWAVEFRHADWLSGATLDLLRAHGVALALADGRWIKRGLMMEAAIEPTAPFSYVRWMGPQRRVTDYSHVQVDRERELAMWAEAFTGLAQRVRTIFGYFNNHFQGHSPASARDFQRRMGQTPVAPEALREQAELF